MAAGKYSELKAPALKPPRDLHHRASVSTPNILCFMNNIQIGTRRSPSCDDTTSSAAAAPHLPCRPPESDATSDEFADPVSPRVGCMGQIKNRKVGPPENAKGNKFRKLRKMFSGKSFRQEETGCRKNQHLERSYSTVVGIIRLENRHRTLPPLPPPPPPQALDQLDPPLPVAKHSAKNGAAGDGVNLWKRRSGAQLEALKLQQHRVICATTNSVSNIASV